VNDYADVTAYPYRPEIFILGFIQLVEAEPGTGRVQLQIECSRLCGFLFISSEASETISECVCNTKFHVSTSIPSMIRAVPHVRRSMVPIVVFECRQPINGFSQKSMFSGEDQLLTKPIMLNRI
jgi:hypothetical protein